MFIDGRRPGRARSRAVGTRFRTSRRVEAVREPVDEVVQTDRVDRFPHLFGSGIRSGEGHVVTDRPGKQEGFLRHDAELAAERVHCDVGEIVTVDCHPPRRRVVEAGDKLGQRRLTRPGGPDESHRLARPDGDVHVAKYGLAGAVAELDVFERDRSLNGRELIGVSFLRHGRCRGQQDTQLVHRRLALLIGVVELDELLDGLEERAQIKNEGRELSDGELGMKVRRQTAARQMVPGVDHHGAADEQEGRLSHQADEVAHGRVARRHPRRREVGGAVGTEHIAMMDHVVALPVVRSDDTHARQALGNVRDHARERVTHP